MKTNRCWMLPVCLGVLAGCSTPPPPAMPPPEGALDPSLTVFTRESLASKPIHLPANYSTQNFRKLQLGVAFEAVGGVDKSTGQPLEISKDLSTRLQTEMAKLKRFTVFSAHNRGGVTFFKELADVDGDVNLKEASEVREVDLILSARVSVTKERHDRYNDTLIINEVECDFSCEDLKTRTVKFAEKAKGRTARKKIISLTGVALAGYDEKADQEQAVTQAAMKALAVVANKLGNTYPVGGALLGCSTSGERLQMDKGFEDGIGKNQQCVVFVNDGGVDIPLGLAEANPASDSANLTVYKWNDKDPDAKLILAEFRKDPKGYFSSNKMFAVGYGLPLPPEWENAYADSMDEQKRLGR